jgi:LuxR family transcriptional regulator, maltose regulon positive regulatory protein
MAAVLGQLPMGRERLLADFQAHTAGLEQALALVLHTLADFADFRGLQAALALLSDAADDAPLPPRLHLHLATARLGHALLCHTRRSDDPALRPVREALFQGLKTQTLASDERLLLAKVLVDHDGMLNDVPAVERVLTLMQDSLPLASPAWQGRWWRLVSNNAEYWGRAAWAQEAAHQLQRLTRDHELPELQFALACEEMKQALNHDDMPRAQRAFAAVEQWRGHVRAALLPHGLRAQIALLLRQQQYQAALERSQLMLALCEDHEVPQRDRAGYIEQQAHAFMGLRRHAQALALLESLRETQSAGQREVLEAIIAMARVQMLIDQSVPLPRLQEAVRQAVGLAAPIGFRRYLQSFPAYASRVAELALDGGWQREFVASVVAERGLVPPQPTREDWPWALRLHLLAAQMRWQLADQASATGAAEGGAKAQKKPLELLALLAAHPDGLDAEALIDELWPSLEAEAPKASLEMAVSRLRKMLGRADLLRVADGRIGLNPQRVWSDVAALEAALAAADAALALRLHAAPLLTAQVLGGRMLHTRQRLRERTTALLQGQVERLQRAGETTQAAALLRQAAAQGLTVSAERK